MKPAELGGLMSVDFSPLAARRDAIIAGLHALSPTPHLMGILNATDDSFFAGSRHHDSAAVELGIQMWKDGATWVDVGGESTRPGALPVTIEEEIARVIPVIEGLREANSQGLISIDTRHTDVARAALLAGADLINDVSGLRDPSMLDLVVESGCGVCIMHMQGEPGNMQKNPTYLNCVEDVQAYLAKRLEELIERGHDPRLVCLDPGIGFGKTHQDNIDLLEAGRNMVANEHAGLLWGVSRKSLIGHLAQQEDAKNRLAGTLGIAAVARSKGIDVLRVHDVREHADLFASMSPFSRKADTTE